MFSHTDFGSPGVSPHPQKSSPIATIFGDTDRLQVCATHAATTLNTHSGLASIRTVIIAAVCMAVTFSAQAQLIVKITTTADTSTSIPDGTGNFVAYPSDSAVCFGKVAFGGTGSGGQQGIYFIQGPPIKVADLNTAIPGGVGK